MREGTPNDLQAAEQESQTTSSIVAVPPPEAIVGYGLLGQAFASRLAGAGRVVAVCDTVDDLAERATGTAHKPTTLAQVAATAESILVSVYSATEVKRVIDGLAKATTRRPHASTIIVSTTLTPAHARSLAAASTAAGLRFVEFPVSGTSAQIVSGEGLGLVGVADHADGLDRELRSLLQILTPATELVGPVGAAAAVKLAINLVLEINRSALAEGIVFAESLGIDPADFVRIVERSAAESKVMSGKSPKMTTGDFKPEGRAEQSLKDVSMMLSLTDSAAPELPLLRAQNDLLTSVVANGDGALDSAVVISELRRRTRLGR